MGSLVFLQLIINVIDIASLAALLFIISFYSQQQLHVSSSYLPGWMLNRESFSLIGIFLLLFTAKSIAGYFITRAQFRFVYGVASRISKNNLLRYLEGNYSNYVTTDSSVHIRRISQQPVEFSHYVLAGIQQIIAESILILFAIVAILLFNARLFILLFVVLLPAVFVISYFTKKKLRAVRKHVKAGSEKAIQHLQESLGGFIESNIYNKSEFFTNRYSKSQGLLNTYLSELQVTQAMPQRLIEVFAVFGLFILLIIYKFSGTPPAGELVTIGAFIAAAYKIIPGIVKINNTSGQVRTYEFTINDLLLEKDTPYKDVKKHEREKIHSIDFSHVSFHYKNISLLQNLDFSIKPGEFIGISADSGKGKTTIVNLLLGFLEPTNGCIYMNGSPTNAAERQHFWNNISYVKQQPFVIYDTILKNITLDDNNTDNEQLNTALKASGLQDFIRNIPEGIDKLISEHGKNISGGQKQRIALARAIYKNSDLIILDEPFNELDRQSEINILGYFKKASENGAMIILITHNRESLSFCNKIISPDAS